jgi:hypothetical protein
MGQNQENVKNLETDRGHGEEIDGDQLLGMILKECPPALRGRPKLTSGLGAKRCNFDLGSIAPPRKSLKAQRLEHSAWRA